AHTHHYIQTGQTDSKFGLGLANGQALAAVKKALKMKHLDLRGLHCHIGSQIFDLKPFRLAAGVMMDFIKEIKDKTSFVIGELDLGGGFGIRYRQSDEPCKLSAYVQEITLVVREKAAE